MKVTINRLAEEIARFVSEHEALRTFYFGDFVDALNDKDAVTYPLLVATPQPSTLTFKKANVVISFVVADKYNEGDIFGIQQVHSDLMQVATDLRAYLRNVQDEAWLDYIEVGDTVNVNPFINRGQDVTAGWVFTITFEIDDVMNYCAIPLVGSTPAPPFTCADGFAVNSDSTFSLAVPSGGTALLQDYEFEFQDENGNVLGTEIRPAMVNETFVVQSFCPDSPINVNGNNEGDVLSGQPINVNLTDGTNPVTPDSVTLVGNDLTLEIGALIDVIVTANGITQPTFQINAFDNNTINITA